jgi:hypothetical protein
MIHLDTTEEQAREDRMKQRVNGDGDARVGEMERQGDQDSKEERVWAREAERLTP